MGREPITQKSILDVAADLGLSLEPSGDEFRCLCPSPTHNDTQPSLYINPGKDCFICFGCNAKGYAEHLYALATGCSLDQARVAIGTGSLGAEVLRMLGEEEDGIPDRGAFLFGALLASFREQEKQLTPELLGTLEMDDPTTALEALIESDTLVHN